MTAYSLFARFVGVLVAALALVGEASAAAIPRPTEGGPLGYKVPCASVQQCPFYTGAEIVVHWNRVGADAPSFSDGDSNGRPDYVDAIVSAGERSLAYYWAAGFPAIPRDSGGPNDRLDVYVVGRATLGGYAGQMFDKLTGAGGSFLVVANDLEYGKRRPQDSLELTLAHELFHVVQNAYFPLRRSYSWFIEGTATGMEALVYPEIRDSRTEGRITIWLASLGLPLYVEGTGCERCYGQAPWWAYLLQRTRVVPTFFEMIGELEATGRSAEDARELFARSAPTLPVLWSKFAVGLLSERKPTTRALSVRVRPAKRFWVEPLAIDYVRVRVLGSATGIAVQAASGSALRVRAVAGRRQVAIVSRRQRGKMVYRVGRRAATVVVTNGGLGALSYTVGAAK